MTRIDDFRLQLQDLGQGNHVVVQVLEDGGAFAQDAVTAEDGIFLLEEQLSLKYFALMKTRLINAAP